MDKKRYNELMDPRGTALLTKQEIALGWHFCNEWDGLLIGPHRVELSCCRCLDEHHPVYKTVPGTEGEWTGI